MSFNVGRLDNVQYFEPWSERCPTACVAGCGDEGARGVAGSGDEGARGVAGCGDEGARGVAGCGDEGSQISMAFRNTVIVGHGCLCTF